MQQLTEAVFRYGGMGCRSVKIVIAPVSLESIKCEFTDYIESFWLKNPQHKKPPASLFYRFACNKGVGIEQSWLDDFLIEETEKKPEHDFVLHWIEGGPEKLKEVVTRLQPGFAKRLFERKHEIGGFIHRHRTIKKCTVSANSLAAGWH